MRPVVFSPAWFAQHQRALLAALAAPVIGRELRDVLAIRRGDLGDDARIVQLLPHAYVVAHPDGTRALDVRTHAKYAKRLRYQLDAVWRAAHAWDRYVANPLVPALNVGFDTLTVYPDPDPEITTVDGVITRQTAGEVWATLRAGAGTFAADSDAARTPLRVTSNATLNQFTEIARGIVLFDTRAVGATSDLAAVVLSLYEAAGGITQQFSGASPVADVFTAAPASDTSLVTADYTTLGTTSQTGSGIALSGITASAYNDFIFNATGRATVNRTGVSKLGLREATYDAAGTTFPWEASKEAAWQVYFADQTGSANDPKLVITLSRAVGFPYMHLRGGAGESTSSPRLSTAPVGAKFAPGLAR